MQPDAALMRRAAGPLEEEQAVLRPQAIDAAAGFGTGEGVEIEVGIEAAQAEAEAVLALRGAVAGALVAAGAREGGDDVGAEVDGGRLGGAGGGGGEGVVPSIPSSLPNFASPTKPSQSPANKHPSILSGRMRPIHVILKERRLRENGSKGRGTIGQERQGPDKNSRHDARSPVRHRVALRLHKTVFQSSASVSPAVFMMPCCVPVGRVWLEWTGTVRVWERTPRDWRQRHCPGFCSARSL